MRKIAAAIFVLCIALANGCAGKADKAYSAGQIPATVSVQAQAAVSAQASASAPPLPASPSETPSSPEPPPSTPAKPLLTEADVDKTAAEILIDNKTIASLDFLADCKNVIRLSIGNCAIQDGVALPQIKSLESLGAGYCGPAALKVIKNNTQVPSLSLEGDQLTDIGALKEFRSLKRLDLIDNDVTDLSPLENMADLEQLILVGGNQNLLSLKPLYGLTKLKSIMVNNLTYERLPREELLHFGSDPDSMNGGDGIVKVD